MEYEKNKSIEDINENIKNNDIDEMNDIDELDTDWIKEYKDIEELYSDFYKEEIKVVPIYYLYINRNSDLFHIKKNIIELSNNILEKNIIISILKKNMIYNKKKYRPISILKYNLTISPQDVEYYTKNTNKFTFLESEKKINDIKFSNSISLFNDINGIYFVLHEQWDPGTHKTKKVYLNHKIKKNRTRKDVKKSK